MTLHHEEMMVSARGTARAPPQIFVDELGSRCGIDAVINKDATGEISDHDRPLPAELHHHRVYGTYEPCTCTSTMLTLPGTLR